MSSVTNYGDWATSIIEKVIVWWYL